MRSAAASVCARRAYQVCVVIPIKRTFVAWRAVRTLRCSRCPRAILIGEVFVRGSHMRPVCRHCASFGAWPEQDDELRITEMPRLEGRAS